jgi:hypothetical protein
MLPALLSCVALAQTTKVLPGGMEWVEGPTVFTYPFGRQTAAIQLLYDADQVTLGQGIVLGIKFRQNDVTATQTHPGYVKDYRVTCYTVTTPAMVMVAALATNVGSATGTIVFQGPVTVPPVQVLTTKPASFDIAIPFTTPYVYDGSQGNLLLLIETADTTTPPSTYRLDAVNFLYSTVTGLTTAIDQQGCTLGGQALSLSVSQANAIVGGDITHTITSSANGAFPVVFAAVGFDASPVDLTGYGMPGCTYWPTTPIVLLAIEGAGGYAPIVWSLPNHPVVEGIGLVSQVFGLAASGQIGHCVTTNAMGTRVGGASGPTVNMGVSFRLSAGWFKGQNAVNVVVAELEGIFP